MLSFKSVSQRDLPRLRRYYKDCNYRLCEYSALVKLMWRGHLHPQYAEEAGCLIVKNCIDGKPCFDYPVAGPGGDEDAALSAIESYCAAYMAEHFREPEAKASIERIRASLERCHENFNQTDEMFIHEEIIRFSHNPLFIQQFDNLRTKIEVFWWDVIQTNNRREDVYREHKYIIDSIAVGDPYEARRASMTHSRVTLEKIHEGCFPKKN